MTAARKKMIQHTAFTLQELLLAVGILVVLFSVSVLSVSAIKKSLQQKSLDSKAEIIYTAAQNRLAELRASGREDLYIGDITPMNHTPVDADDTAIDDATLYYADNRVNATAASILPEDKIDSALWSNNWVIEFDPASGSVYAVFYSESNNMGYDPSGFDALRVSSKARREKKNATIGYYGGNSVHAGETDELQPNISIDNGEKLIVSFSCARPDSNALAFYVTLTDEYGHSVQAPVTVKQTGKLYSGTLVLDDLSDESLRFCNQYPTLVAGSKLKVSLRVKSSSLMIDEKTVTGTVNSLFGNETSGNTAVIECGRHLQNLDSDSGVNKNIEKLKITKAVQTKDLFFSDDTSNDNDWFSFYSQNSFKPIDNPYLTEYNGSYDDSGRTMQTVIYGLSTRTGSSAGGLFGTFYGGGLKNIRLSGTTVSASNSAGGLAGDITGNTVVQNCAVYLSLAKGDTVGKTEKNVWINGRLAGGLAGSVSAGTLTVQNSFASTVLGNTQNTQYCGGLVGYAAGSVSLSGSYADCYLYGQVTGGLAGSSSGSVTIADCYSAGYQTSVQRAAGFVSGTAASMNRCYTVCAYTADNTGTVYSTAVAVPGSGLNAVYYLRSSNDLANTQQVSYEIMSGSKNFDNGDSFVGRLGSLFTVNTANTVPYNLMQQGLSDYSFPRLAAALHYGDWDAQFESGVLAYYEKYADNSYGFDSPTLPKLSDTLAVRGDGYGLIFDTNPQDDVSVRYQTGDGTTQEVTLSRSAAISLPGGYWMIPLGRTIEDSAYESPDFYQQIVINGVDSYLFNPHFAKTVTLDTRASAQDAMPAPRDGVIYVRTARQLYDMSAYYAAYAAQAASGKWIFSQNRDINYSAYNWGAYSAGGTAVTEQNPIGSSETIPFRAVYNGGCYSIQGISFVSDTVYVGMFGYNSGTVRNVVLAADYGAENRYVKTDRAITGDTTTAYIGVLAGKNNGTIWNCAAAGYSCSINITDNAMAYIGGLVGENAQNASIRNSSSDCPFIKLDATSSQVKVGGFTGRNRGGIYRSYALGAIQITKARYSSVQTAGFSGENFGVIRTAYCATSMVTTEGTTAYGFTPAGGSVQACYYLFGGTYNYVNELRAYNCSLGDTRAIGKTDAQLNVDSGNLALTSFGSASAANSKNHSLTKESQYPYPAVVLNAAGEYTHYGEWITNADMGELGMFYWELEEGGGNSGYHFRYIGTQQEVLSSDASSLCQAHDDGGIVTAYGYGYYYKQDSAGTVTLQSTIGFGSLGNVNETASEAVSSQIVGYRFVAYTTTEDLTADSHLYLQDAVANGTWILSYAVNGKTEAYRYAVNPFFADSLSYQGLTDVSGVFTQDAGYVVPGAQANPYEIRSIKQLQYINWNGVNHNTTTAVDGSEVTDKTGFFPYLVYVDGSDTAPEGWNHYWTQSHDLNAQGSEFTPLGSMYDKSAGDSALVDAYIAYFGGVYNGSDYTIRNVEINSTHQAIGLFAITVGAKLENIVLYSDQNNTIAADANSTKWYSLGGLVGFAADGDRAESSFSNCTVSGYKVIDNRGESCNSGWGGANVGGLTGSTNMDIDRCTAITDIVIAAQYYNQNFKNIRVGGLVGSCRSTITNCYTGGSIVSTMVTRGALPNNSNVWIGGIVGGIIMKYEGNLEALVGTVNVQAKVINSYCYVKLPAAGANQIRNVQSIASNGEMQSTRFLAIAHPMSIQIQNCYCLRDNVQNAYDYINMNSSTYWNGGNIAAFGASETRGILLDNDGKSPYLSYEQMSDASQESADSLYSYLKDATDKSGNKAFSFVTSIENGVSVYGKYSYPGTNQALQGRDYPFPTVLTQTNAFDSTQRVNVHYGEWPNGGLGWEKGIASLDMLLDYDAAAQQSQTVLRLNISDYDSAVTPVFTSSNANVLEVTDCVYQDGYYNVTVKGLGEGTTILTASVGTKKASCTVDVTATLTVSATPMELSLYTDESASVVLSAASAARNGTTVDYSNRVTWSISADTDYIAERTAVALNGDGSYGTVITGSSAGDTSIYVSAVYELNGHLYKGTALIAVTVKEKGTVGLANTEKAKYNQVSNITASLTGSSYDGSSATYPAGSNAPKLKGSSLFLYASGTDYDINQYTVEKITVDGKTVVDGANTDFSEYYVALGAKSADDYFSYCPLTVTGAVQKTVTLGITLKCGGKTFSLSVPYDVVQTTFTADFLDANGSLITQQQLAYGAYADLTNADSWTVGTAQAPTGYHYGSRTDPAAWNPAANLPVYHATTFRLIPVANTYTVVYHDQTGAQGTMDPQTLSYNTTQTLAECTFEKTGYLLQGWSLTGGTQIDFTDGQSVLNLTAEQGAQIDLYAVWNPITYSVVYNANGGTGTMLPSTDISYDTDLTLETNTFMLAGSTFAGWSLDPAGEAAYADGGTVRNLTAQNGAQVTLYAVWNTVRYTVSFNTNGGNALDAIQAASGTQVTLPAGVKGGSTFYYWTDGTNRYAAGSTLTVTRDIELTARWITFNLTDCSVQITSMTPTGNLVISVSSDTYIDWLGDTYYYTLPRTVTVRVGGTAINSGSNRYRYSRAGNGRTATLTVYAAVLTGDVSVTISAY